jgi:hypothetical protein
METALSADFASDMMLKTASQIGHSRLKEADIGGRRRPQLPYAKPAIAWGGERYALLQAGEDTRRRDYAPYFVVDIGNGGILAVLASIPGQDMGRLPRFGSSPWASRNGCWRLKRSKGRFAQCTFL